MRIAEAIKNTPWDTKLTVGLISLSAFIQAADAGLAQAPHLKSRLPDLGLGGIWPFLPAILVSVAALVWIVKHARSPRPAVPTINATTMRPLSQIEVAFPTTGWDDPMIREFKKHYLNETVSCDGRDFIDCIFENVTFEFQGTRQCRFTNAKIVGNAVPYKIKFTTGNPVVGQAMTMMNELNLLKDKAGYDITHKQNHV